MFRGSWPAASSVVCARELGGDGEPFPSFAKVRELFMSVELDDSAAAHEGEQLVMPEGRESLPGVHGGPLTPAE